MIRASAQRLTQVVVNLLVNAKQALTAHPKAVITVETRRNGEGVDIEVRDNSTGATDDIEVDQHMVEAALRWAL